jgi:hypothetical protein
MSKALGFLVLAAVIVLPAAAQSSGGMAAMQYYVGNWTCTGGDVGQPPQRATLAYTLDSGILREWVVVPAQGKMKSPYMLSIATTYDSKNGRYAETALDNTSAWWVSYAKPFAGNTETWIDRENSTGILTRAVIVRADQNTFTVAAYATIGAMKPNFKLTCKRSS